MIAAIAAVEERHVVTIDITSAYLNASMKKEVHMALDEETTKIFFERFPEYSVSVVKHGKHKCKSDFRKPYMGVSTVRCCGTLIYDRRWNLSTSLSILRITVFSINLMMVHKLLSVSMLTTSLSHVSQVLRWTG
jgi:hypothetical protein